MMRGAGAALLLALAGCAHVEAPPGGPADTLAPRVIAVRPENLSVHAEFGGAVRFQFDETISEREVSRSVLLAPAPGGVKVGKERDGVTAEPRRGWAAGRIYHATLLAVVQDLFGNRLREPVRIVFSTGPPIPENVVGGRVLDPLTGRGVAGARVEARWRREDLAYLALTDSAGRFRLDRIPEGEYVWVAFDDRDQNLTRGPFEPGDSLRAAVGARDSLALRFRIVEPDTTPPALDTVRVQDSLTVVASFDDALDPLAPSDSILASIRPLPDGAPWPLEAAWHAFEYEAARRIAADTAERAAPPDTARPGREEAAEPVARRALYLRLGRPLAPGSYEVRIERVRNLLGLVGGGTATLVVPAPEPPPEPAPPP